MIGWVWIVLGSLSLAKSAVNLILWRAIRPAIPMLAAAAARQPDEGRGAAIVIEHFTAIAGVQIVLASAVLLAAWQFLRLSEWARVILRIACVVSIAYVAAFAGLWTATRTGALPGGTWSPPSIHSRAGLELAVGLALCVAIAAGFVAMLAALGGRAVRDACARRS